MAQVYSTGPAHLYVALPGGGPAYVGTSEQAPQLEIQPAFVPVNNDLAGPRVPFEMMYGGEQMLIVYDLTRWNEAMYAALAARFDPGNALGNSARGTDSAFARGTMIIHEERAIELWVQFPRNALAAYATMPPGYHVKAGFLNGPDRLEPGVRPYKVRLVFNAIGKYDPTVGDFILYDHDMSGLPNPD